MRIHLISIFCLATALLLASPTARASEAANRYQLSYDLEASGDYRAALEAMSGMPERASSRYTYKLRKGWLLYCAGEYRDAETYYRQAIELEPQAVEARLGLLGPLMALRLWNDAVAAGQGVLELDPHNYSGQSKLAWSLYSLGRYSDAEPHYAKLVAAYPSDVDMRAGLGWCLLKQGRADDARRQFQQVLRVAPRHSTAGQGLRASGG